MKESLSAIPKQPIFRETFTDEQTTRLNGGVPTAVTYFNGVASFNGTSSSLNISKPVKGVYSVRYKFTSFTPTNGRNILDCRFNSGTGEVYQNSASSFIATTGTIYVDGISTNTVSSQTREIIISGITLSTSNPVFFSNYNNSGANIGCSAELIEIYDYTLTANEVKNLYEGKRNRIIDLKQNAPSSANYYQGVGVAGNYVSTPNASANSNNGDKEIIAKIDITNLTNQVELVNKDDVGSNRSWRIFITSTRFITVYAATDLSTFTTNPPTSDVALPVNFIGFLKTTFSFTGGNLNVIFSTSSDGITYTQLGTQRSKAGNNLINTGSELAISIVPNIGISDKIKIYRVTLSNSIGGAPVVDFNPQLYVSGTTLPSSTGEVYTINGTQGFIGNGSRPEILNIDGRNGVIANKYSGQLQSSIVVNGDFALGSSNWSLGANWSISNGQAQVNSPSSNVNLGQTCLILGVQYKVTYTIVSIAGTLDLIGFSTASIQRTTAGTYTEILTANATTLAVRALAPCVAVIDNIIAEPYIPYLINTAVTPVRQGSVWGMDFNVVGTSKLDCGNYDSLVGDITLIAWYKARTTGQNLAGRIFDNGQVQVHAGGYFTRNNSTFINFISAWKLGVYQQLIITSTSTGITNMYVNGVLVGSANQSAGTPVTATTNMFIGNLLNNGRTWNGTINQPRIIKGILNAQEVQQLFDNERHDYGI